MRQEKMVVETGLVEFLVNEKRTILINPSDQGFVDDLYGLVSKLSEIHEKTQKAYESADNAIMRFEINRAEDGEMRKAVDSVFGENFCSDVFQNIRLFAMAEGMTVVENFLYGLLDKMDEDITANVAKRDARIAKYTKKYQKYSKQ